MTLYAVKETKLYNDRVMATIESSRNGIAYIYKDECYGILWAHIEFNGHEYRAVNDFDKCSINDVYSWLKEVVDGHYTLSDPLHGVSSEWEERAELLQFAASIIAYGD